MGNVNQRAQHPDAEHHSDVPVDDGDERNVSDANDILRDAFSLAGEFEIAAVANIQITVNRVDAQHLNTTQEQDARRALRTKNSGRDLAERNSKGSLLSTAAASYHGGAKWRPPRTLPPISLAARISANVTPKSSPTRAVDVSVAPPSIDANQVPMGWTPVVVPRSPRVSVAHGLGAAEGLLTESVSARSTASIGPVPNDAKSLIKTTVSRSNVQTSPNPEPKAAPQTRHPQPTLRPSVTHPTVLGPQKALADTTNRKKIVVTKSMNFVTSPIAEKQRSEKSVADPGLVTPKYALATTDANTIDPEKQKVQTPLSEWRSARSRPKMGTAADAVHKKIDTEIAQQAHGVETRIEAPTQPTAVTANADTIYESASQRSRLSNAASRPATTKPLMTASADADAPSPSNQFPDHTLANTSQPLSPSPSDVPHHGTRQITGRNPTVNLPPRSRAARPFRPASSNPDLLPSRAKRGRRAGGYQKAAEQDEDARSDSVSAASKSKRSRPRRRNGNRMQRRSDVPPPPRGARSLALLERIGPAVETEHRTASGLEPQVAYAAGPPEENDIDGTEHSRDWAAIPSSLFARIGPAAHPDGCALLSRIGPRAPQGQWASHGGALASRFQHSSGVSSTLATRIGPPVDADTRNRQALRASTLQDRTRSKFLTSKIDAAARASSPFVVADEVNRATGTASSAASLSSVRTTPRVHGSTSPAAHPFEVLNEDAMDLRNSSVAGGHFRRLVLQQSSLPSGASPDITLSESAKEDLTSWVSTASSFKTPHYKAPRVLDSPSDETRQSFLTAPSAPSESQEGRSDVGAWFTRIPDGYSTSKPRNYSPSGWWNPNAAWRSRVGAHDSPFARPLPSAAQTVEAPTNSENSLHPSSDNNSPSELRTPRALPDPTTDGSAAFSGPLRPVFTFQNLQFLNQTNRHALPPGRRVVSDGNRPSTDRMDDKNLSVTGAFYGTDAQSMDLSLRGSTVQHANTVTSMPYILNAPPARHNPAGATSGDQRSHTDMHSPSHPLQSATPFRFESRTYKNSNLSPAASSGPQHSSAGPRLSSSAPRFAR